MKQGDRVKALDESGNVRYTGVYLGAGHPAASVPVRDRSKVHHAVQVGAAGDVVYLEAFYWTILPEN